MQRSDEEHVYRKCMKQIAKKYNLNYEEVEQLLKTDEEQCRQLQKTMLYLYPDTVKAKPNACPTQKYYRTLCQLGSTIKPTIRDCDKSPRKKLQQQMESQEWQKIKDVLQEYLNFRPNQTRYVVDGISLRYEDYDEYYFDFHSYLALDILVRNIKVLFRKDSSSHSRIFTGKLYGVNVYVKTFNLEQKTLLHEKEIYRYLRMLQHVVGHPYAKEFQEYFINMVVCIRDKNTASIITEDCGGGSVHAMIQTEYFTRHMMHAIPKLMMEVLYSIFLLQQAGIVHNDLHMRNVLIFESDKSQKVYTMYDTVYESYFSFQIKIFDFDRSCVPLFKLYFCDNPQNDVFAWFRVWKFYLSKTWLPLLSNTEFMTAWNGFHRDLQAVNKRDYTRLDKYLKNERCGEEQLQVLDLPTILPLFYKNFESLLRVVTVRNAI